MSERRSKYGSRKTYYDGNVYDSAMEAGYARNLDLLLAAGEIKEWGRPEAIVLVEGARPRDNITYRPDFCVVPHNGQGWFVDVKGVETGRFHLVCKLLRKFRPQLRLLIVSKRGERWLTQ